jgi:hypothetical protein
VTRPAAVDVNVHVKVPEFPGAVVPRLAMDVGVGGPCVTGAPERVRVRVGVTLLTAAVPVLVTVMMKVTTCPIVAGEGEATNVLKRTLCPMVPTLDAATTMGGTAVPVFEPVPEALPLKEMVPTPFAL